MSGLLSRWPLWGALLGLVVAVAAWVAFNPNEPPAIVLRPQDPQLLAMGQQVYNQHCAACHGAQLQGQANWRERGPNGRLPAPPHDSSGHTWHHPDEVLFQITKYGVAKVANLKDYPSDMPAYQGQLSDEEIVAVLSWIKAQWPAPIQARHDAINRNAKAH